jgi:hypothetical protein
VTRAMPRSNAPSKPPAKPVRWTIAGSGAGLWRSQRGSACAIRRRRATR